MKADNFNEPLEKLVRLLAPRREDVVELLVHYKKRRAKACTIYEIIRASDEFQEP